MTTEETMADFLSRENRELVKRQFLSNMLSLLADFKKRGWETQ